MFDVQAKYIEKRLASTWGDRTPILFDGTRQKPVAGQAFIRITITWLLSTLVAGTWEKGVSLEEGLATIEVYTTKDQGARGAFENADLVQQIYRNYEIDRLKCRPSNTVRIGQEKEFFHVNVHVPFYFHHSFTALP